MGQFSMHFTGLQDFVQDEADLCKKIMQSHTLSSNRL